MTRMTQKSAGQDPPGAWRRLCRLAKRGLVPLEQFLEREAASGILLLVAAAIALVWANSPWRSSYEALCHLPLGFELGHWSFRRDFLFLIDDGLMTIFFFVVGLEIRREIHGGELRTARRAALPIAAALGGMILPACIFLMLNAGHPSARGWGSPVATDIAFAVGVLALLGKRVPPALRILLLALAVIDDIGAIVIIAIFYSSGLEPIGLAVAGAGVGAIFALKLVGVRSPWGYVPPAALIWGGAYAGGLNPTLAGVIVGLLTPARGAVSPAEKVQRALESWVVFGIMPLFALANAGVQLGGMSLTGENLLVFFGVAAGLLIGKPLGIAGLSWISVRVRVAALPRGVTWSQVGLVGVIGGIGFTMAIFTSSLAFGGGAPLETAKLAVLTASLTAGVISLIAGRLLLPAARSPERRDGGRGAGVLSDVA